MVYNSVQLDRENQRKTLVYNSVQLDGDIVAEYDIVKYENRQVMQSNPLNEACKAMELYEGKLYYLALLEFNFRQDNIDGNAPLPELVIPTDVVLKVFGGNKTYYKRLKDAASSLYDISFARTEEGKILLADRDSNGIIDLGNGEFAGERIFTSMKFSPREGGLIFRFSENIKPEIHKLFTKKGGFTLIKGKTLFSLSSMYAIRLIEMLLRFQNLEVNRNRGYILLEKSLQDLRLDLNILKLKTYENPAQLKLKILEPAREDINNNTPYKLDYTPKKKGKRITGYEFKLYYPDNNNVIDTAPTDELISDREERKAREINITANVDNTDADIYDVLRRYDVGKIIARRLANKYEEKEIREKIRTAIAYRERHKVTNFPGLIYDLITGKYTVNVVEQTSLFEPKYTSAERQKIEKEQRAANKVRIEENKCRAPGEQVPLVDVPDIETPPAEAKASKPSHIPEPPPDEKDRLSVSIETIKMFVDGGKAEKVVKELAKLAKKGISIDDVRALNVEELEARYKAAGEAKEPIQVLEPTPVEKTQDPEPETTPEPNIFDELEATPEAKAAAQEQRDLLAQFSQIELDMINYSVRYGEPLDDELKNKIDAAGTKLFNLYRLLNK